MSGLRSPVSVVRDRWGIPHITAQHADDLFLAQGFIQAQDRLFQMDLWRRASQGRLSETLGANFIERDAMTRRIQFRGDIAREWASYGPDARQIALAFTRGINAWVSAARADPPEEFVLAGWQPEYWKPEDLLNRTDAFLWSGDAQGDLLRARLAGAIGVGLVDRLFPQPDGRPLVASRDVDFAAITYVVADTLRRIGTPPFFSGLAVPVTGEPRGSQRVATASGAASTSASPAAFTARGLEPGSGNAWAVAPSRSATGSALLAVDPHRQLDAPSSRYLVHLTAPGWNVVGATSPWMPGVAIGHNDRIAWGMTGVQLDTQDIFVEQINPDDPHQVKSDGRWVDMSVERERLDVKGRAEPFEYERLYTRHGVVIGLDRERHLAYTLRWSGTEPGGAAELAALAIGRAETWSAFRAATSRWKVPAVAFVYADADGHIARLTAGMAPVRTGSEGLLPAPGWTGESDWAAWRDDVAEPELDPPAGYVVSASRSRSRRARINEALAVAGARHSVEAMKQLQLDTFAWNASRLVPLLNRLTGLSGPAANARARLLKWDRLVSAESEDAALYVAFEAAVSRLLAERRVPKEFAADVSARIDPVRVVTQPTTAWFDRDPVHSRDALLADALAAVAAAPAWDTPREMVFSHPLGIFEDGRRRFNVGPFPMPGYAETVFATTGRTGPSLRVVFDVGDWDRAVVTNPPGQSGSPASPHYDDLTTGWAAGEYVPLLFSADAVRAAGQESLTLAPQGGATP